MGGTTYHLHPLTFLALVVLIFQVGGSKLALPTRNQCSCFDCANCRTSLMAPSGVVPRTLGAPVETIIPFLGLPAFLNRWTAYILHSYCIPIANKNLLLAIKEFKKCYISLQKFPSNDSKSQDIETMKRFSCWMLLVVWNLPLWRLAFVPWPTNLQNLNWKPLGLPGMR